MHLHELKVLLHSMIKYTDRDGHDLDDYIANATDMIDSARRCGYITADEKDELYSWLATIARIEHAISQEHLS